MKLPVARGTFRRDAAQLPLIPFKNRLVEPDPVLNEDGIASISRPAMRKFAEVGTGPVRALFSAPGLFSDQLFVVSGTSLYSVSTAGTVTLIGVISAAILGDVSWAPVANVGVTPARLFFCEGGVLWVYTLNGQAMGHFNVTGVLANNDTITIGATVYKITTGSVNAGTPAGTLANPWLVAFGTGTSVALTNLYHAINNQGGVAGTDYSTALTAHPTVTATRVGAAELYVNAIDYGTAGNTIVTTDTAAGGAWDAATLAGGGAAQLRQVNTPSDSGAISVATINSYVIVVPVQSSALLTVGKFYWIEPGETTIDPLNFATAERAPDGVHQVGVFGNMFWLFGLKTTEPWTMTGDINAPVQRYQSVLFDRGSWEGTAVQVKDSLIVVDEEGGVFQIAGGQTRISRPDIEARIRRAMNP